MAPPEAAANALYALLKNNPSSSRFQGFGSSVFGLSERTYGGSEEFRRIEEWLVRHLKGSGEVSISVLKKLALGEGVRPDFLVGTAKVSEQLECRRGQAMAFLLSAVDGPRDLDRS